MANGRPRHPVTRSIDDTIDLIERVGGDVRPSAVMINVKKQVKIADFPYDEAMNEALHSRIRRRLRDRGFQIADADDAGDYRRKTFWTCTPDELEEQRKVKLTSSQSDQARMRADEMVITFLREKEKELGYEVCPDLFHVDIDRIYAMNGVSSPGS